MADSLPGNDPELQIQTSEGSMDLNLTADSIAESILPEEEDSGADTSTPESATAGAESRQEVSAPPKAPEAPVIPPPPDSLKGEIKAKWAEIPADVRTEILRREQDFHNGYAKMQPLAELGEGFGRVASPYVQMCRQYGVNIVDHVEDLLGYHAKLMFGKPEEKAEILLGLARDTGLDLAQLVGNASAAQTIPNEVQRELATLRAQLSNVNGRFAQADLADAERKIDAMFNDSENFPHILRVAPAMVTMYQQNPNLNIYTAYAMAVAQDSALQSEIVSARVKAELEARQREGEKRAAAAAKARGVKMQGSGSFHAVDRSDGVFDLDDMLRDSLDDLRSA